MCVQYDLCTDMWPLLKRCIVKDKEKRKLLTNSGVETRGSTRLGENTRNLEDSGSKSSPSFQTSVFNVRRIKSKHHKKFEKEWKSPLQKFDFGAIVSNESRI